ncbi:MAG: transposase domain-containing protein [Chitinophagaceae bacterium]
MPLQSTAVIRVLPQQSCLRLWLPEQNYLFAGSHEASKLSGMLYYLLGTCKIHGTEPYAWLKDVLHCIADHPVNRIPALLPHRYKK